MDATRKADFVSNMLTGLLGAEEKYSTNTLQEALTTSNGINAKRFCRHLADFLSEVILTAEKLGMTLSCHPDDQPFLLLLPPRIMTSEAFYARHVENMASPAVEITLCAGSLGVRAEHDLSCIIPRLGN